MPALAAKPALNVLLDLCIYLAGTHTSQPITGVKRELEDAKTPGAKKKVSFATTPSEEAPTTPGGAPPPSTATKYKDRSNGGTLVEVQNKHLARREPWADAVSYTHLRAHET